MGVRSSGRTYNNSRSIIRGTMGKYRHQATARLSKKLSAVIADAASHKFRRGFLKTSVTYLIGAAVLTILTINILSLSKKQEVLKDTIERLHASGVKAAAREAAEYDGDVGTGGTGGTGAGTGESDKKGRMGLKLQAMGGKKSKSLIIEVLSSIALMSVKVGGKTMYEGTDRGIHCVVLNQVTGKVMATRVFDTYVAGEDAGMKDFLNSITDDRIIVFGIKDDGAFQLGNDARQYLKWMGSKRAEILAMRFLWTMAVQKGGQLLGEAYSESISNVWGPPVNLRVKVNKELRIERDCSYTIVETLDEDQRRREFCKNFEGFGNICNCNNPDPIAFTPEDFPNNQIKDVPVAIIASNRPNYLQRTLSYLLAARGANPAMVNVFIDGYPNEVVGPMAVAKLYGVQGVPQTPLDGTLEPSGDVRKTARITQHYKAAFTEAFAMYPMAKYLIVLEEDLEVSPDFFSYFSQTKHLMDEDDSLYCVSAWNDNAFDESSCDPAMLFRVETMPGLGWMLKRTIYKAELEKDWPKPHETWDWDMWMRQQERRKDRECIIPDVSRTFHFSDTGVNVHKTFSRDYFNRKPRNRIPYVELKGLESMTKDKYEELIERKIKSGKVIDHSKSPCLDTTFPKSYNVSDDSPLIIYVQVEVDDKEYKNWLAIAKCFKIWDLEERGQHKGMWRFHLSAREILVIGVPKSPYSKFKPPEVKPISTPGS